MSRRGLVSYACSIRYIWDYHDVGAIVPEQLLTHGVQPKRPDLLAKTRRFPILE
jgi:hypothetical protein